MAAPALLAPLIAFAAKQFAVLFALRLLLITLTVTVLPILVNNLIFKFVNMALQKVDEFGGDQGPIVIGFTGIAAYLGDQLGLVDAFSITMGFITAKAALSMIPFSPIK